MTSALRREQILDVAVRLAVAKGFPYLTLDRVCRESGSPRSEVTAQFGDLAGLISALVDREANTALSLLLQGIAGMPAGADLVEAEVSIVRAMLGAAAQAPDSWRLLLAPAYSDPPELHHRAAAGRSLAREHLRKILVERLPADFADPHLTAHLHQLAGEELVRLHLGDPEQYPVERILRQVAALAGSLLPS